MATTTIQTPNLIQPVYNPIIFQVQSNFSTETGFKYVFEIHDKDGIISTKRVFPFPNEDGRIDVSMFVREGLSYDKTYKNTGIYSVGNSLKVYNLYIGEDSSVPQTPSSTGRRWCFNGVFNRKGTAENFNWLEYIMTSVNEGKFLTNSPTNVDVYLSDYYSLNFFNGQFMLGSPFGASFVSDVKYIGFRTFDKETGNPSSTYVYTNPDQGYSPPSGLNNVDDQLKGVGVGPRQLNSTPYTIIASGSYPADPNLINETHTHYEVWGMNDSLQQTSQRWTFNILTEQPKYTKHQITFLNRLGGWSYFTFDQKTFEETKIKKDSFKQQNYYEVGTNTWGTTFDRRGESIFNVEVEKEITFNSRFIDQPTFDFMEELLTSPAVYLLDETLGAVPLIITDSNWFNLKKENQKEIRFSIKTKMSNKININI